MRPLKEKPEKKTGRAVMLGIGLDHRDEHLRITRGRNFRLVGGSEETHEKMTETAIKVNERLKQRGKELDEVSGEEFHEILQESTPKE